MPLHRFHPAVRTWFEKTLGEPTASQRRGWPTIATGSHVLIAAPTGSGKTLAAFLHALDSLLRRGGALEDRTQVLYVSPLKALGNDVQKNLLGPLAALRERDPSLPEVRVLVRSGDTPQRERQSMTKRPPHVLVTTPESLYVLLTSKSGAEMLKDVRTVIVDEIHAIAGDKRGSHLALSLERLVDLAGEFQRIGLSATQRPIERVAEFLVGPARTCTVVDTGHLRELDLAIETPGAPLGTVASEDHWLEIVDRIVGHVNAHRTTLVFANTRKMAERLARRLADAIGKDAVTSHHGSLSRERRLEAERRLKDGELKALCRHRVPRARHRHRRRRHGRAGRRDGVDRAAAATRRARRTRQGPRAEGAGVPADPGRARRPPRRWCARSRCASSIACASPTRHSTSSRSRSSRRASRTRATSTRCSRWCGGRFRIATSSARRSSRSSICTRAVAMRSSTATASAGGCSRPSARGSPRSPAAARSRTPRSTDVMLDPEGTRIGSVDEDFAVESTIGDVFQLGNASWRVLKIERGRLRVADAHGAPPSMPFWFGEAPARTDELCAAIDEVREHAHDQAWSHAHCGLDDGGAAQLADYLREGREALGTVPTRARIVLERFFDESGGTQLVVHAPFGSRITKAFGLALRKRFCRGFGFELQAAANEEAIVLSLGPMHSFPLEDVFEYLHPNTARELLVQAVLVTPMFASRWRWNVGRALVVPRSQGGKRVPAPLLRMRADDALAQAFPEAMACGENLPPGDLPVPLDHPLVRQTVDDCLTQAMDADGLLAVLRGMRDGTIDKVAIDRPTPSPFARAILNAAPYAFLDDAPLEERRTQAVVARRALDAQTADGLGALDPDAVTRVREQAWPGPDDAEELHEALLWMGFATEAEIHGHGWTAWRDELAANGRVERDGDRWFATEASRDPVEVWRGRLAALGPLRAPLDDPALLALEREGTAMRIRLDGHEAWCDRRLLARIHRETLDRLRASVRPVDVGTFVRFLAARWHAAEGTKVEGPAGIAEVAGLLSGLDVPASGWERVLRRRLARFRPDWLDQLTLSGELVWLRLWGSGPGPLKNAPICLMPRAHLDRWLACRGATAVPDDLGRDALVVHELLASRGALFPLDLERDAGLLPSQLEAGLAELVGRGVATADSFAALRALCVAPSKRGRDALSYGVGRWSLLRGSDGEPDPAFVLGRLLARYGVVFHRLLRRERVPMRWRDLLREARLRELAGELRGGHFVAGVSGEQFALPGAVAGLRGHRDGEPVEAPPGDPLDLAALLTLTAPTATDRERVAPRG